MKPSANTFVTASLPPSGERLSGAILTWVIVSGGAILFCSKGVFVKMAYAEGATPLDILALRMGIAFPFFVVMAVLGSRGRRPLRAAEWVRLGILGFVGYYLAALVNFTGLQYITVGLERIILYSYPAMVLMMAALGGRQRVRARTWLACGTAWTGVIVAFAGEAAQGFSSDIMKGGVLVLLSAGIYAVFVTVSGRTIEDVGAIRFTGLVVGFSCVFVIGHRAFAGPLEVLCALPVRVHALGSVLALFGTVLPALLTGIGLRRAGAQKFAVFGTIGPVATLVLAAIFLRETPGPAHLAGLALALAGGLGLMLEKRDAPMAAGVQPGKQPVPKA